MTSAQLSDRLSLSDFLKLPETKPASEYINGKIYQKPMPKGKHSRLQTRFSAEINKVAEPKRIALAFTELRCTFGGRSIVPDITVFTWSNIPLDDNGEIENTFSIAPNWTIEILSPEQSPTRVINNILFCLNHGTELGWLIDPQEKMIMIFKPGEQLEMKQGEDLIPVLEVLSDWKMAVSEVFAYLTL
jgi:Uma2 family endonuclease